MRLLLLCILSIIPWHYSFGQRRERVQLTQEMLDSVRKSFVVKKDYSLDGRKLTIPKGLTLVFEGGSISNGELTGENTVIIVNENRPVFGDDLVISGLWNVPEVHDGWFFFDNSPSFVSNRVISNILAFSNDVIPCHIFFEEDRTYYFELPYKGRADLGNTLSVRKIDGKVKRDYDELYNDDFAFLRVFSIPSNTHITINNTLKMLPTNQGAYFVFWEHGKENITIDGKGMISGDNDWHIYDTPFTGKAYFGECGFIFRCFKCRNFTFKDITISDAFGDGIIFSGSNLPMDYSPRWASDLTIDNVKILRARRNGITVGARNVLIRNCYFKDCGIIDVKGTAPNSAIDFEPDHIQSFPEIGNQNVVMEDCTFVNNYYDVASSVNNLPSYWKIATIIRNCRFTSGIKIKATYWMRFEKCYIPYLYKNNDNTPYYSKHIEFVNCDFGEEKDIVQRAFIHNTNKFFNCRFSVVYH